MKSLPLRAAAAVAAVVVVVAIGVVAWRLLRGSDASSEASPAVDPSAFFVIKRNGGWCWFQDERVIVDGGKALIGTVAGTTRDGTNAGDVEVTTLDLADRSSRSTVLHAKLQSDDHASPSIVRLADGRYLSAYTTHGRDALMRWRISDGPGESTEWAPEQTLKLDGAITYSNLALEPGKDGRLFNFFRRSDNLQGLLVATPGEAFEASGAWLAWTRSSPSFNKEKSTRSSDPKPYIRYASRGGVVHFITTEDHPRAYDNSVYHGFIKGHALHDSLGNVLDDDIRSGEPVELTKLTRIYEGNRDNVAWTIDLDIDGSGRPFAAFVVQKDGQGRMSKKVLGGQDHRFHFARFDGKVWNTHEIAYAGSMLYKHEVNYTGLIALVPKNPNVMFMSTNVDPVTGKRGEGPRYFELYRGATQDEGKTWQWRALTKDSTVHNIRPVVPEWDGGTLVVWLRGTYESMGRYDLDVVGMLNPAP